MNTNDNTNQSTTGEAISGGRDADETMNALLGDYFGPKTRRDRLFRDEEEALLTAVLLELRGEKSIPSAMSAQRTDTADYEAIEVTVEDDGLAGDAEEIVADHKLNLNTIWDSFNLRFDDQIQIAFKSPNSAADPFVTHDADDSPIPGVALESQYIWLKKGPNATTDPTVRIEAGMPVAGMGNGTREAQRQTNDQLDTTNTKLSTTNSRIDTTNTTLGTTNTRIGTTNTKLDTTNDRLGNEPGLDSARISDDTTGSAFPPTAIPHGVTVAVQAPDANNTLIKVGKEGKENYELRPGQSVGFGVEDLSAINVVATTAGDEATATWEA